MRVAIATETLSRDGGTAAHVLDSAHALLDAGHDILLVVGNVGSHHVCSNVIKIGGLDRAPLREETRDAVLKAVRSFRPDTVHLHGLHDSPLVRRLRREAPVIWSVHNYVGCMSGLKYFGSGQECTRKHGLGCLPNIALRGCDHRRVPRPSATKYREVGRRLTALREADAAVVYSDVMRRHLSENGVNRVHVIPLFVETQADLVPLPTGKRILFSGRLVPYKGVDVLIQALNRVQDATLEICGDGWSNASVRRRVARLGVQERVSFLGWQDASHMREIYDRSRCLVVPSLWPEPFGLVGIEAMARARPVIASDTGGIRQWLRDGETGYLVRPGDEVGLASAINRMLANHTEASVMGRRGAEVVGELFSPAAFVAKTLAAYRGAMDAWNIAAHE